MKSAVREIMARICALQEANRRKYVKQNARTAKKDHCQVPKIILLYRKEKISQNYNLFLIVVILLPPKNLH